MGTPAEDLPQELLDDLTARAPALRRGRPARDARGPAARLAEASFPILGDSGHHHPAATPAYEGRAQALRSQHRTVEGAEHEFQMVAGEFNAAVLALWGRVGVGDT